MSNFYLGHTKSGAILKRSSTRNDFMFAAVFGKFESGKVVPLNATQWSASKDRCVMATRPSWDATTKKSSKYGPTEIVQVNLVSAQEFRDAIKGSTPKDKVLAKYPNARVVESTIPWNRGTTTAYEIMDGNVVLSAHTTHRPSFAWSTVKL